MFLFINPPVGDYQQPQRNMCPYVLVGDYDLVTGILLGKNGTGKESINFGKSKTLLTHRYFLEDG